MQDVEGHHDGGVDDRGDVLDRLEVPSQIGGEVGHGAVYHGSIVTFGLALEPVMYVPSSRWMK